MDPTSMYLISGRFRHVNETGPDHAYIRILHELPLITMDRKGRGVARLLGYVSILM